MLLEDGSSQSLSGSPLSNDLRSARNGTFSSEGGFPGLTGGGTGCLHGALLRLLPGATLQTFLGLFNTHSGSGSPPSSPSPVDRKGGLTCSNSFCLPLLAVPPQRSVRNEPISPMKKGGVQRAYGPDGLWFLLEAPSPFSFRLL